jgi:hypothetical protein
LIAWKNFHSLFIETECWTEKRLLLVCHVCQQLMGFPRIDVVVVVVFDDDVVVVVLEGHGR